MSSVLVPCFTRLYQVAPGCTRLCPAFLLQDAAEGTISQVQGWTDATFCARALRSSYNLITTLSVYHLISSN